MRNNYDLDMLLLRWKDEAKVKNGIAYNCKNPRDKDISLLTIYTAQPMRMENLVTKYHPLISSLPNIKANLMIDIIKVDRCLH